MAALLASLRWSDISPTGPLTSDFDWSSPVLCMSCQTVASPTPHQSLITLTASVLPVSLVVYVMAHRLGQSYDGLPAGCVIPYDAQLDHLVHLPCPADFIQVVRCAFSQPLCSRDLTQAPIHYIPDIINIASLAGYLPVAVTL